MPLKKHLSLFFLLTALSTLCAQNNATDDKAKIASVLENYFDLEREAIHLHLDKSTFINNEAVWYQGYIINRKTNKPYFTTNVFMVLYDENGNPVSEKLQYASNGIFFGKIELGPKLKSGLYYIQAYTNWMNNFSENESTVTKIHVINPNEGLKNYAKINAETLTLKLTPEGNSYVLGIPNQMAIQLQDCRGNAPENTEVQLQNDKNEILRTIKLNPFGYGKFEIIPTQDNLKISLNYKDKIIEKRVPTPEAVGYTLDINNFTVEGKTIIKIRSNQTTVNSVGAHKLYLAVHQDQKYSLYDVTLNPSTHETEMVLNSAELFEGINTVRLIDNNLKQWAERLIYISPKRETSFSVTKNKNAGGKIKLIGYSAYQNSSLSISVLPMETKSLNNNSIIAGLTINPYLTTALENANYYLNNPGRLQRYELDLVLLHQEKTKYDWETMKIGSPKAHYTFDIGITLKGKIDESISKKPHHKAKLVSFKDFIMMQSDITEQGDYHFDHILLADSTYVSMSLQKLPEFESIKTEIRPQVIGRKRSFNKPFKNTLSLCADEENIEYITDFDLPKLSAEIIQLEEVKVESKKKKLTYENRLGNGSLRAFKIDENVHFRDILSFIEANGFTVRRNRGDVTITTKIRAAINQAATSIPDVYIDERALLSFDELDMMTSDEVDEIYLDPNAIVAGMNNRFGIIKIYRKKGVPANYKDRPDPNSFYIKDGFARYFGFENVDYTAMQSVGFENFGLIHWIPKIKSEDNGQFYFEIDNYNLKTGKFIIEGMTAEGQFFHEERVIDLQ
ncbi:hypothetical protein [Flavobacterium sp.]|uniref:hypothetical protein n=1 Tax=Flavobacterium sp. TaxID=239 RepID=UPI002FDE227C